MIKEPLIKMEHIYLHLSHSFKGRLLIRLPESTLVNLLLTLMCRGYMLLKYQQGFL
jgi:hypothetical protein